MKYIYSYSKFRINEEFLGKLLNYFKGLFKKMSTELQKLENDPNKIKEYIITNILPTLFKKETDNFKSISISNNKNEAKMYEADTPVNTTANQQNANQQNSNQQSNQQQTNHTTSNQTQNTKTSPNAFDEKAFALVDAILNKDSGIFGKQGIGLLFNDKSLQGDNMKVKRITIEYVINSARDQVIKTLKYDQKKNIKRSNDGKFVDNNYLPSLKQVLLKTKNDPSADNQNVDNIIKWVDTSIRDVMINNVKAIREDDIKSAIQKGGVSDDSYKEGDAVRYKMDGFQEGIEPDNQKDKVGEKPILRIEGNNYIFKDSTGREFTKSKEQIIGKSNTEQDSKVVSDLKNKLHNLKNDPQKMTTIDKVVNLINTPGGVDKINSVLK